MISEEERAGKLQEIKKKTWLKCRELKGKWQT